MTVLVLADPAAPFLAPLQSIDANVVIREDPDSFSTDELQRAEVLVNAGHHAARLRTIWPRIPNVKWIHSLSAGVEELVFDEFKLSPVPLTNARGVYKKSLAEWTMLSMLYFAKDVTRLQHQKSDARWEQFDCLMLEGATLAIIGYGEIGRAVARLARPFGMRIIATRRNVAPDELADEVRPATQLLPTLSEADYVVLCSPHTAATHRMIDARAFAAMKSAAVFINIGRGAVVDEDALIQALRENRIRGAALDVFTTEPLPPGSPLWDLPNVLLSPHCADHTATWQRDSVDFFVENFRRYRAGQPLENLVDKQAGY